jgi:PAS domain S-box-containing protein
MNIVSLFPILFLWATVLLTSVEVACADKPLLEPGAIQSAVERSATDAKGVNTSETSSTKLSFTPEEQAWFAKDNTIRVRYWQHPPYFYLKDGVVVGISVDFLNAVSNNTGITFQLENRPDRFSDVLKGLIDHRSPVVVGAIMPTPERKKVILFTRPYIHSPRFIFTRDDTPFVSSIEKLFGERVAVVKDYATHKTLVEMFPAIDLLVLDNNEAALRAVSSGEAIAFIGDLVSTPVMINEFGLNNLKVVSPSGLPDHPLAMGIRNDWPELQSILNKGLAAIPAAEKAAIINQWSSVKFDHGISPALVWTWVLIVVIGVSGILLLLLLWTKSLKKQVQNRTFELYAANQSLKSEIAGRERTGEALANSESKYRDLIDNSLLGVFDADFTGKFSFVNDALVQMYEFDSTEQMLAIPSPSLWANPEDREQLHALLKKHGMVNSYEVESITHSGLRLNALISARLYDGNITGMVMDITKRKQAEEKLLKSESKYRTLFENLPQKIFLKDRRLVYISCNKNYASDLGIMPEEVAEKTDYDFFSREIADKYREDDKRIMETGETERLEEQYLLDGKETWVATIKTPVRDKSGAVTGLLGSFLDITERRRAEEKLQQYQQRLKSLAVQLTLAEEHERRRIAEDLHDHIGQSLALTRMQLAAACKGAPQSDERAAQFDDISQSLLKAIQDTRHLIFELSSPSLIELGLAAAISEWMDEYVVNKYWIEVELFDHAQELSLDSDLRTILFRNVRELLTNAIKHARAKKIIVWLESRAESLEITIQDDGVGFDYGKCRRSGDDCGGFGLFSVRERMSDLGGKLTISSQPGEGCKAVLLLPLHKLNRETEA